MAGFPCPHCKNPSITWWQKYKAAKWVMLECTSCHGRVCSQPFILVFYTLLYVWDVLLFGFVAVLDHNPWYWLVMLVGWLMLDGFALYLPLSALKPKPSPRSARP